MAQIDWFEEFDGRFLVVAHMREVVANIKIAVTDIGLAIANTCSAVGE